MRTFSLRVRFTGFMLLLALVGVMSVSAQTGPTIPAIVAFSSDLASVTLADVEDGTVTTTLNWHIVNVSTGQRVALDYFVQNGWRSLLEEGETLSPVDSREVTLLDPLAFSEPTFRLTLISGRSVLDQQYITLPYGENSATPEITSFETSVASLDVGTLRGRNARVTLNWDVANRIPLTNLVFEQILSETERVSVELPRATLYIFSTGEGPVQPTAPTTGSDVVIRMSVVNVISGQVYDTADVTIPTTAAGTGDVINTPIPATVPAVTPNLATPQIQPPVTETPNIGATPQIQPPIEATVPAVGDVAPSGPVINVFTINPTSTTPGTPVTIAWNIEGSTTVQLQEVFPDGTVGVTYVELPPLGAVSVSTPTTPVVDAVIYRLTASNGTGQQATQEITVALATG